MVNIISSLLLVFSISGVSASIWPVTVLDIANKDIQPDGFNRSAVLAAGVYPAPLLQANRDDTFLVNVVNNLQDPTMLRSTSIHWHGLFQHGSAWADGPVGVTQCPIAPGHSFLYNFTAPGQAGTFWYHSHYGTQYCDGLRGPLVIYDPNDPQKSLYDVDNETTGTHEIHRYHTPSPSSAGVGTASSTLINGKGRYPGGPLTNLTTINVEQGKRYRFRLVSISCDPNYIFSIAGHQLTIIEADGQAMQPVTVDSLRIFAGQRYSFVLSANQQVDNYWIRSLPNSGLNDLNNPTFPNGINSAILRYVGAPPTEPTANVTTPSTLLNETQLHPLTNPQAPANMTGQADEHINLIVGLNGTFWTINNASFVPPSVPVLLQILSGAYAPGDLLPPGSIYYLPRNKVIELTIPGGGTGTDPVGNNVTVVQPFHAKRLTINIKHPFHLHGHAFSVIQSADSNATNYEDPVRRDVVSIGGSGSNVTIRFVTDNPGPWILHCHIDWHLNAGLAIVFAEDEGDIEADVPTPVSWDQLCPIYSALPASATSVQTITSAATSVV